MDSKNTEVKRTGSWLPFFCWVIGFMVVVALMYILNNQRVSPWEDILKCLLIVLGIFLFIICPVWMLVSSIKYWRSKDYIRAIVGAVLTLAIVWTVLYAPMLNVFGF